VSADNLGQTYFYFSDFYACCSTGTKLVNDITLTEWLKAEVCMDCFFLDPDSFCLQQDQE